MKDCLAALDDPDGKSWRCSESARSVIEICEKRLGFNLERSFFDQGNRQGAFRIGGQPDHLPSGSDTDMESGDGSTRGL